MVLESLINIRSAERHPIQLLIMGMVYSSISVLLCLWVFQGEGNFILVALTMLACTHLMYNMISVEEAYDIEDHKETFLIREHALAVRAFAFLFIGLTIAFSLWFTFLPEQQASSMFSTQLNTIKAINSVPSTGHFLNPSEAFRIILSSNMRVLLLGLIFSLLYGIGAIFILTWNASVIGAAMGTLIKNTLASLALEAGSPTLVHYFHALSFGFLRYAIHGIPEILSYFTAALAGGIISVAVIKHDLFSKKFKHILMDSIDLIILSILLLIISALIEVYITPLFF